MNNISSLNLKIIMHALSFTQYEDIYLYISMYTILQYKLYYRIRHAENRNLMPLKIVNPCFLCTLFNQFHQGSLQKYLLSVLPLMLQ